MLNNKARLWKKWKVSNSDQDKESYLAHAKHCRLAIRKYQEAKEIELIRKNNMQCFYRFVNRKCGSGSRSGPTRLRASDGSFVNSDEDMANIFNEYFSGILWTTDRFHSCN